MIGNAALADEIVRLARAHREAGTRSGVLAAILVPAGEEIPSPEVDAWIKQASQEAKKKLHARN